VADPVVTFVVPCYRLAHLLPDCVRSILAQTFEDLEVLIMDDCSPDDTPAVAASFGDPRVRHVRNDPNLGHLRNYNKGIGLARGRYVWLISADDYLRRPYVLERYVELLERRPRVGYAFCAGVAVRDGAEAGVVDWAYSAPADRVFSGHEWLKTLLQGNVVLAPSGLVRKECYDAHGAFPLDLPWAGDWYLWCLFALHHDAAWFTEPMVCYRDHSLSMTTQLTREKAEACCREEIFIPWELKRRAVAAGYRDVARECLRAVAGRYVRHVTSRRFGRPEPCLTIADFEASLASSPASARERAWVRSLVYAEIADRHYWKGELGPARELYGAALRADPWSGSTASKRALLAMGGVGQAVRKGIHSLSAWRRG
jgi:glycosyltransferase involved in cell wall biosynthesis